MRRLSSLAAALLLPAIHPVLLGAAVSAGLRWMLQAPALAQNAEAIAKVAQAITVRIEGATQGSGVLVKREGNRYTALTAWHVLSGQRPGEELDICRMANAIPCCRAASSSWEDESERIS